MIRNLSEENSILHQYLIEIRDVDIQLDPLRFRHNLKRIGSLMAIEISKTLDYKEVSVRTPLGIAQQNQLSNQLVLGTILRAGLPMYEGFLDVFDRAESAFIGAFRSHENSDKDFEIDLGYNAAPDLNNKHLILIDPMLATGSSLLETIEAISKKSSPEKIIIAAAVSSEEGIRNVQKALPEAKIWTATIDPELNSRKYIVPGLGDAGDLAFGPKL